MNVSEFNDCIKKSTNPLPGSLPSVKTYNLSVKQRYNGLSILDFYCKAMPHISKEIWKEKIESGILTVEGKPVKTDRIVKTGEKTKHFTEPQTEPDINTNIELVEWNDDFIIINKPAPLPMHSGGRFDKNTLTEILKTAFPNENFKLVHRIDANTTGIVVIAKNSEAANEIIQQLKDQSVQKEYLALVEGIINKDSFVLEESISKTRTPGGGRKISDDGKEATTKISILKRCRDKDQTLLSVIPHSGRTNQIRIHLANMEHAIVGDKGYKDPAYFKNNPLTYDDDCLFLHAWKLSFSFKNKKRSFKAKIPTKFDDYTIGLPNIL